MTAFQQDERKRLCSSFATFDYSSFNGRCKSIDCEIHDTFIGKTTPTHDKKKSQLLGVSKPTDGRRLSQSLWAKSENVLWNYFYQQLVL
jgi:hypothetical protein